MSAAMAGGTIPAAELGRWGKGVTLVSATRRVFPLATLRLAIAGGASGDPPGKEGLTAMTARMLERGTRRRSREALTSGVESLGATLGTAAGMESVMIASTALSRNLEAVSELLLEILLEPAFAEEELEKLRAEMLTELAISREEDRDLGDGWFHRALHGSHPYGHFVMGTEAGLKAVTRDDVVARWRSLLQAGALTVAGAGDVDLDALGALLDRHAAALPPGTGAAAASPEARELRGIEVLLVDKPDRSQTQIFLGRTAVPALDPDQIPLQVAMHAFGGMFTARLMQEVRVKRGWSYGASARLEMNRGRGTAAFWTFPANGDTIACVRLLLDLYRELHEKGISEDELGAAKGHLLNMLAFEVETPEQLVARRLYERLLGLPDDWTERWVAGVESTTRERASAAAGRVLDPERLQLTIVCTAEPFLQELSAMAGVRRIEVVPFDVPDPDAGGRVVLER